MPRKEHGAISVRKTTAGRKTSSEKADGQRPAERNRTFSFWPDYPLTHRFCPTLSSSQSFQRRAARPPADTWAGPAGCGPVAHAVFCESASEFHRVLSELLFEKKEERSRGSAQSQVNKRKSKTAQSLLYTVMYLKVQSGSHRVSVTDLTLFPPEL